MKKILALLLVLMMTFAMVACGDSDSSSDSSDRDRQEEKKADKNDDSDKAESEKANNENTGDWTKVGETAELEGAEYTVNAFMKDAGGDMPAEDGNTYLLTDMTIKNTTSEEIAVSSLLMFELKDADDTVYDISIGGLVCLDQYEIVQADGDVPADGEFECGLAFEIPEDAEGLTLVVKSFMTDDTVEIPLD